MTKYTVLYPQILENHADAVVLAGARSPEKATGLKELSEKFPGRLHILPLDVSDDESMKVRSSFGGCIAKAVHNFQWTAMRGPHLLPFASLAQ